MNDDTKIQMAPRKRGMLARSVPIAAGMLLGGAGVGGGLYAVRPDVFKLSASATQSPLPREGERREARYYALTQPFTSNLKDSQQFVQLSIALGTYGDEAFVDVLKANEMALRSAALMTIADQRYDEVTSSAGKVALAQRLRKVLNDVLKERDARPAIDRVYFTGFVVQ